jgi:predicted DNA-binding transcriptional regulator AlpA
MLSEKQVLGLIPIARSTLWRWEARGAFPPGVCIEGRRKLYYEDEVVAWQDSLSQKVRT